MKNIIFLMALGIVACKTTCAQKEMNNWFFGYNSSVSFKTGSPVFVPGSNMTSLEGCSAISDRHGNLLFYTNGIQVWNNQHQLMPNGYGLHGDTISTQSAIITAYPGNENLFFVFTVSSAEATDKNLEYSVVDMRLNSGLGDVTTKNTVLLTSTSEKVTAVQHRNANDIWVITHRFGTDEFYSFRIDCAGLDPIPVISKAGGVINIPQNTIGYLKVSPDKKKLAVANTVTSVDVYDFEDSTGRISNPQTIPFSSNNACGPYGVEFSPDSKLLYVSELYACNGSDGYSIWQYQISAANISSTRVLLQSAASGFAGALQLGPDNKIYIAYYNQPYLGAVVYPDVVGLGATLIKEYVAFSGNAKSGVGLPAFTSGYNKPLLGKDTVICDGTSYTIRLKLPDTKFLWSDGSTEESLSITRSGPYWVQIDHTDPVTKSHCIYRDTVNVTFQPTPFFNLGEDIAVCSDKLPVKIEKIISNASYLWQDSSINSSFQATSTGIYWMQATVNGCSARDSIMVTTQASPYVNLGRDTTVCANTSFSLTARAVATKFLWNTGSSQPTINPTTSGIYWVEITNAGGCTFRDSVLVTIQAPPALNLGRDTALCEGQLPLLIGESITGASYLWQDGSSGVNFSATKPGLYWVEATANGCTVRDSISISASAPTPFELGNDTVICGITPYTLTVNASFANYLWSTGATTKSISVTASGLYWCQATTVGGCSSHDTISLAFSPRPNLDLGKDTALCADKFPLALGKAIAGATYTWQDGSQNATFNVVNAGTYYVEVSLGGCSARDTISIAANAVNAFNLGSDISRCGSNPITLAVPGSFASYLWNDGSTGASIQVTKSGQYWSEATNNSGCSFRDTVVVNFTPGPSLNLGNDIVLCQNNFPITLGQTIAGATYLWQDGTTSATYTATSTGKYWLEATVNGCSVRDTIDIALHDMPPFTLGRDTTFCQVVPVSLSIKEPADRFLWSTGSTASAITVTTPGEYWAEATNKYGCAFRDTIKIIQAPGFNFSLGRDTVVCQNLSLLLDVTNVGNTYKWQDNSTASTYLVNKSGLYSVTIERNGCRASDTVQVSFSAKPVPSLGRDTTICPGQIITLVSRTTADRYLWQDGSTSSSLMIKQAGRFSVQATNQCGSATDDIVVAAGPCKISIPNAFTPAKSTNNSFRLTNAYMVSNYSLQVFNRWGQEVYQSNQSNKGWDGKYKSQDQPAGTYVFILKYTNASGGLPVTTRGTVLLIR